jgi:hypothetical protein
MADFPAFPHFPTAIRPKFQHEGATPNTVGLGISIKRIQPQMDRMNADELDKNAVFIYVLHLRVSAFICG